MPGLGCATCIQAESSQRLHDIEISLAGSDDGEPLMARRKYGAIERILSETGAQRRQAVAVKALFLGQRGVRPARVQAVGRQHHRAR